MAIGNLAKRQPENAAEAETRPQLAKTPTGIRGFDLITNGGLPQGRPTLVCGGPGCGKTLFSVSFLINGVLKYDEPGVMLTFEEKAQEVAENVASLGVDINGLIADKKLSIDYVRVERTEIEESGEYDLEGLFVRLDHAIKKINAKRVVLDTIEALFAGLTNTAILRAELRRLFEWLRNRGVTAVITGERGEGNLTRHGMEEYVSDCVILLDTSIHEQVVTRRLQVVKYRGSGHGTNQYPFLIDDEGISVLPITSASLTHPVNDAIVSSGIRGLDSMLGRKGFYRGSTIMYSGSAGTGKTTFASKFAEAACARGERCLYFAFEESPLQIIRNVRSVGVDLEQHVDSGLLKFSAARPSTYGFEMHLARMARDLDGFQPSVVVVDPLSAFRGDAWETHATLMRMIDMLKTRRITAVFTRLTGNLDMSERDQGISSLIDTWISLGDLEVDGDRTRGAYIMKSRGMNHTGQVRQYVFSDNGVEVHEGAFAGLGRNAIGLASVVGKTKNAQRKGARNSHR